MKNQLLRELGLGKIYDEIERALGDGKKKIGVNGLSPTDELFFYLELQKKLESPLLIIKEQQEAESLLFGLQQWLGEKVELLPKRNLLPYRTMVRSREEKNNRLRILKNLTQGKLDILILSEEAFLDRYLPVQVFRDNHLRFHKNQEWERNNLIASLIEMGYQKENHLELKGQFTVRGDIIDLFPVTEDNPIRLDFFGDVLEKMKVFDLDEQRTLEELEEFILCPGSELLPPKDLEEVTLKLNGMEKQGDSENPLREELALLGEEVYGEEFERFFPAFGWELRGIESYFPVMPTLVFHDYSNLKIRAEIYYNTILEDYREGEVQGLIHPLQKEGFHPPAYMETFSKELVFYTAQFDSFELQYEGNFTYEKTLIPPYHNDMSLLIRDVRGFLEKGYSLYLLSGNPDRSESLKKFFKDLSMDGESVYFLQGYLEESFLLKELGVVVLCEKDIFGQSKKNAGEKKKKKINPFIDIKPGDYVVHEEYGIAHYKGIEQKKILGVSRDYLILAFAGTGMLFLPVENMDVIEKYIGAEAHKPRLSNLSNNEWRKTKEKVRISVSEIAKDLLKLYTERKLAKGQVYSPDGPEHEEFANRFPYVETEDQGKAIQDVRKDMEGSMPMDRVIIGDVGYGKTEVALRAVFKAVMDGKQVALLSPTTVLAQQHYRTFTERFEGLPFKLGLLNRFVSKKDQKTTLEGLKGGQIDILIGTHRILSKDVSYRDLGLLIIDEEQKFGVVHKEKIKNLKSNVDCLVLSATPIPRTLHMALAGARDLSVIETAPKERHPVQTYVLEYEENIVRNSILKELKRKGQVFYVYNRVETMEATLRKLEKLVPEARIAMAHGQLDEKTLESRMLGFLKGEVDVLLCTTIVENGLDIKNANTLLVEKADHLGLAQIYQLKGRVGRSNRIAYAYFMFDKNHTLTETARKRLKAIRELTEMGSGFKIAMLDLEIRGAGNLLGREQHGHMLTVGFDLYCKILEDEVDRLSKARGEEEKVVPVELSLGFEALIPEHYIEDVITKVGIYKRIADLRDKQALLLLMDELKERFGKPPEEVENLFILAGIRILAMACHLERIRKDRNSFILTPKKGWYLFEDLQDIRRKFKGRVFFRDNSMVLSEDKIYLLEFFLRELVSLKG